MSRPALSLFALAVLFAAAEGRAAERLVDRYPWLNDRSVWRQDVDLAKSPAPPPESLGAFALGNGYVFAHEGLTLPSNRLMGLVGPVHSLPREATFPDEWVGLSRGGRDVEFTVHEVRRVRRSAIVITKAGRPGDVELFTVDFAPPRRPAVLRVLFVLNVGSAPVRDAELRVFLPGSRPDGEALRVEMGGARLEAGVFGAVAAAAEGELRVPLPKVIPPGGEAWVLHYLATSASREEEAALVSALRSRGIDSLGDARAWWQTWFLSLLEIDTPDPRVDDLVSDALVSIEVQRSAADGSFAALTGSREPEVRSATGAVFALLEAGAFDEVRAWLDYVGKATTRLGRLPDSFPPGVDVSSPLPARDFETLPVPRSEIPSWLIEQHARYAAASGDVGLAVEWYPLLRRAFLGQETRADGLLPFHGGEPYLAVQKRLFPELVGDPNEFIAHDRDAGRDAASLDASILFVAAAEPLRRFAAAAERPPSELRDYSTRSQRMRRAIETRLWTGKGAEAGIWAPALSPVTGERHLAPFAPVSLRPLLSGYATSKNRHAVQNLDGVIALLIDPKTGRLGLTPSCAYATGDVTGLALKSYSAVDDPESDRALELFLAAASPSGGFAAIHGPDGRPATGIASDRLQPGILGTQVESLVSHLVGREGQGFNRVAVAPRLPAAWDSAEYRNVRVGTGAIDIRLERASDGGMTVTFLDRGSDPIEIEASVLLRGANFRAYSVNGLPLSVDGVLRSPRPGGSEHLTFAAQLPPGHPAAFRFEVAATPHPVAPFARIEFEPRAIDVEGASTLLVAATPVPEAPAGTRVVDSGLPLRPGTLAAAIVDPATGRCRVDRLVFARGARASGGPLTFKTENFWKAPVLVSALERFVASGGTIVDPAMKGRELYARYAGGTWRFAILAGTNREKTPDEIESSLTIEGLEALEAEISRLAPGDTVFWFTLGDPPAGSRDEAAARAGAAAKRAGATLEVVR